MAIDPSLPDNPTAQATAAKVRAPYKPGPFDQFGKWATTPIGLQDQTKSPAQVMARPGVQSPAAPAPAPAAAPGLPSIPAAGQMPDHVKSNVRSMGQNPSQFHAVGNQLISARTPEAIQADVTAHPPITTAYGQSFVAPKPAVSQPVGVEGAAVPGQAQLGVQSAAPAVDPTRAALHAGLRQAQADQSRYGQGQWVFPPGTGTEAVYQQNTAPERTFGLANAMANYNQTDPAAKIGLLHGIAHADPATRGVGIASLGVTPDQAASIPRPASPGEPVGQDGMYDPAAAGAYQNPETTLLDHARRTAMNPSPANIAALQKHVGQKYANNPEGAQEDSYIPISPADKTYPVPSFMQGIPRAADYLAQGTFGPSRNDRVEQADLLRSLGINLPGLTQ